MNIMNIFSQLSNLVTKADTKRRSMKVQTLIFSKDKFKSSEEATNWAAKHNFKASKVDETGNSFRLRQEAPGKFKKFRTIDITDGVKAVVGKCGVMKSQPGSSSVHVPTTDIEIPAEHKQPVRLEKGELLKPSKTAGALHEHIMGEHDNVGGTIKEGAGSGSDISPLDGSQKGTTERFVFGPMSFDIDKAREMGGTTPNATAQVTADWSHKINIDTKAALKSKSENPVMVAQIPTTNGVEHLLIDGHHRMFKALHEGKPEISAHLFSPKETMELMETTPDLMDKMMRHLGSSTPATSDKEPEGDISKEIAESVMEQAREDVSNKSDEEIENEAAVTWTARAIAAFEMGDVSQAEDYAHEALEHAALIKDGGKTVGELESYLRECGLYKNVEKIAKDTEEGMQGDLAVNGFNNAGARSSGGMGDNVMAGLYDMQEIIGGMDWELAHDTTQPDLAKEIALANLEDDPLHYKKLRQMDQSVDWSTGWGIENSGKGLRLDLGSGKIREPGHIGFDLQKHDHGTIVHDLHGGIPVPDSSASSVLLRNSLEYMDKLSEDPKPLLSEIQRVLMPGGQFVYEGPNQIQNQPEWLKETWNEKFRGKVGKVEGRPMWRQEFARVAQPDAATANDSEPRIGVAQYDMLPADTLLAMDALGYYWSDATSSGRGNRAHGYPSQGALVKEMSDEMIEQAFKGLVTKAEKVFKGREIKIHKADNMKQIVYGVVLAPNEMDLQEDWMHPDEIEKTAHAYMMNARTIGKEHETVCQAVPVESYIAPQDMHFSGQYGDQVVKKGSWVLGVKVLDPEEWKKVVSGEYTGFSVGGFGQRSESEGPNQKQW